MCLSIHTNTGSCTTCSFPSTVCGEHLTWWCAGSSEHTYLQILISNHFPSLKGHGAPEEEAMEAEARKAQGMLFSRRKKWPPTSRDSSRPWMIL